MRYARICRSEAECCDVLLGIKGLVSHGSETEKFLRTAEQVSGLSEFIREPFEMNLSDYEIIYGVRLSKYGEVMTPPPMYIEAVKYADEKGIPVIGLDMNENEFSELYQKNVGVLSLVRHSIRKKRLLGKDYGDNDPYAFVQEWSRQLDKVGALRKVDVERASFMAARFNDEAAGKFSGSALVFDFELWSKFTRSLVPLGYRVTEAGIP
ncbi:hypothetical protein ApAK_06065 [Thermoplasmatales archaeon AK]|nr:hypothetical protein [Thermoplasmatales archaeon AK]